MDKRLKKVLDAAGIKKKAEAKKLADLRLEEKKKEAAQLKKDKTAAKLWVEKRLFELIKEAEEKNQDYIELDDGALFGSGNLDDIPAKVLADAASKIDGIRIKDRWVKGFVDHEMGSEPDRWVYQIWWKPDPYPKY